MEGVGCEKAEYNKESEMSPCSLLTVGEKERKKCMCEAGEAHSKGKGTILSRSERAIEGCKGTRHKANAKATQESKCEMKASSMHHNKKRDGNDRHRKYKKI